MFCNSIRADSFESFFRSKGNLDVCSKKYGSVGAKRGEISTLFNLSGTPITFNHRWFREICNFSDEEQESDPDGFLIGPNSSSLLISTSKGSHAKGRASKTKVSALIAFGLGGMNP